MFSSHASILHRPLHRRTQFACRRFAQHPAFYAKIVQSDIYLSSLFVNSLCSYNSAPHAWTQYHLIGALVCGHNMAGVIFNMYEMYRTLTQECLLFI